MAKTAKVQVEEPTMLSLNKDEFKNQLSNQIEKGKTLAHTHIQEWHQFEEFQEQYWSWHSYTSELLKQSFNKENNEYKHGFDNVNFYSGMTVKNPTPSQKIERYFKDLKNDVSYLEIFLSKTDLLKVSGKAVDMASSKNNHAELLANIFNRFHQFAIQLRVRHANRQTIVISDEYDVQDSLHAILKLYFDDIREEEYTPSYAGSSTRMDFLLKNEQIVIEVKKTRAGLNDKELGQELTIDIAYYKNHSDCKQLLCFVYDPDNRIRNARGIENDLSRQSTDELTVKVFIRP